MEMQIMNCNGLSALQSCLGYKSKNTYKASTDCAELLQEIVGILTADSDKLKSRQVLSTLNIIGNDLVPLLKSTKDLESFQYAIELLRKLTDPVESLVIHDGKPLEGGLGLDINNIYIQSRAYCLDHDLLTSLVKMINTTMKEDVAFYRDEEIVLMIDNCFLFLKNLLHMTTTCEKSMQWQRTKLMKMIFDTRLSDVLLNILKIDDSCKFSSSGSQVIALLFKDANDLFIKKVPDWISNDDCDVDEDDDEDDDDDNDDGVYDMRILDDTLTVKSFNSEDCILSEISSQLQKFADKLIDESFGLLVKGLLTESMSQSNVDDTYFLWIVSYFTKYISCRFDEVPSHLFECLMSVKLCSALIYQGVRMCESLMALQLTNCWNVTYQRKLHLTVTCLSHIFKICKDLECDDSDLNLFQCELSGMKSLQGLFLLLLNQFKPHVQGLLYLSDLIQANHHYLILMNKWQKQGYLPSDFDFKRFIAGYANKTLMNTFSYSLANFENNPSDLNNSILTLMHHIVGDVGKIEALLQLPIIIIFGQIWEKSFCPDFSDLIETVLTMFLKFSSGDPDMMANQLFDSGIKETERSEMVTEKEEEEDSWEDEDLVFSYLASDENCTVSDIVDHLKEYNIEKTAVQVAKLLSTTGMVSDKMLSEIQFILLEENGGNKDKSVLKLDDSMEMDDVILMEAVDKTIKLIDTERLTWLQTRLIDAAKAKAYIQDEYGSIPDSIPLCCQTLKKSTPLTLFTAKEENYFKDDNFVLLLELMEFKMAATHIEVYPRIPYDWTVSVILKKSEKLGEIDPEDVEYLSMYTEDMEMEGLTALPDLNLLSKHPAPSQHQIKPMVLNHGRGEEVSWLDYVQQMNKM